MNNDPENKFSIVSSLHNHNTAPQIRESAEFRRQGNRDLRCNRNACYWYGRCTSKYHRAISLWDRQYSTIVPPPEILAFAPFDPTLGTLTAVNFNLESQITDYLTATSSDPLGAVATDQTTVQIGLSAFDTETKILTNGCSTFGSTSCSSVAQTYWEFIVTLTGSSIYNFTSTGYSYFTISPSVTHSCTVSDPFDSCTIDEFTQFDYSTPTLQYPSGFMKVTYDYTPFIAQQIPVPEPSSASVLGSGLFGLFLLAGWETRRRRKAARGSFGET